MKLPLIQYHIVSSKTLQYQYDRLNAMSTILSGAIPELEQVCLALHELKCGGNADTRRKRYRALDRQIKKLNKTFAVDTVGENEND